VGGVLWPWQFLAHDALLDASCSLGTQKYFRTSSSHYHGELAMRMQSI
jgi:hypothetical protein